MIITYERSPLPRCNLYHRILHEQANPLLGKFCLLRPGESENLRRMIVNSSVNARQTNVHIFHLLGSTDMEQRVWNSSCFGDHDATKVYAFITFPHCERNALKIYRVFFMIS